MCKFIYSALLAGVMLLVSPARLQAFEFTQATPPDNLIRILHHNTHAKLLTTPLSSSSVKVAAVYWLPDFLKDNFGLNNRTDDDKGGGDKKRRCENYHNMSTSCDKPKEADEYKLIFGGLKCYKNCHCPAKFQYTSENCKASEGKMVSGEICEGKSEACICQPTVKLGTGEKCDLYCGSNCVKKSCKPTVTAGTGEQCTERCASNSSICTARGCASTSGYNSCSCGGYGGSVYSCGSTYYKYCSSCCAYSCSLSSCPANGNCSYESCSGKYCLNSCKSGYKQSGNSCVSSCPVGYTSTRMSSCPSVSGAPSGRIVSSGSCYTCMYDWGNVYYTMATNTCTTMYALNNQCCGKYCYFNMSNFEPHSGGGPCSNVVWNVTGHIYCTYNEPYKLGLEYTQGVSQVNYGSKDSRIIINVR